MQVVCGVCHSYSAHLYEVLGAELGGTDGMTMKSSFCNDYVSACEDQIVFSADYCEVHTGGGDDLYWSYPYVEREYIQKSVCAAQSTESNPPDVLVCHCETQLNFLDPSCTVRDV